MPANTKQSIVIRKESVCGVVKFYRSPLLPGEQACKCCGEKGHVYAATIELDKFHDVYPEHFGRGVREFVNSVALNDDSYEGKKVRITVEVF